MKNTLPIEPTLNNIETSRQRLLCPICGKHTVLWLLPDTEIKNLPIKCKLCGKESIINFPLLADLDNCTADKNS